MQRIPDPYRILGLRREATTTEVKAAHRRLAKRFHPDAPQADAARFLAVQDAYELLRDPLRRREWDRRHAPGPVRAEPTSSGSRRRRAATADPPVDPASQASPRSRRDRASRADTSSGPNDRPPGADRWTWTAEGVPWWEDAGAPRARRTPRRRPTEDVGGRRTAPSGRPSGSTGSGSSGRSERVNGEAAAEDATAGVDAGAAEPRSDFDVFSRSSGAAWSSASRAYFRRRAADMPSGAANPDTPRWSTPVGAPVPRRYDPQVPVADPGPSGSVRQPSLASRRLGATLAALFRRGDR